MKSCSCRFCRVFVISLCVELTAISIIIYKLTGNSVELKTIAILAISATGAALISMFLSGYTPKE